MKRMLVVDGSKGNSAGDFDISGMWECAVPGHGETFHIMSSPTSPTSLP